MQLMTLARDLMVIIGQAPQNNQKYLTQYNNINALLCSISNQQSEELKVIE